MKKILTAFFLAVSLSSCSANVPDGEIISALNELAAEAYELNTIIYGDGLTLGEKAENGYYKVSKDALYTSVEDIKKAMEEVFSPEYIEVINNTAFKGVSVNEGSVAAKFIQSEGILYVNPSVTENFGTPKLIDTKNAYITKKNKGAAVVVIPYEDGNVEVTMRKVDGKWLIDSPIF